jgi:hypothetical protein
MDLQHDVRRIDMTRSNTPSVCIRGVIIQRSWGGWSRAAPEGRSKMHRPGKVASQVAPLKLLLPSWIPPSRSTSHIHPILHNIAPLRAQPSGAVAALDSSFTGHYRCCSAIRMHISRNESGTRQLHHSHQHALTPTRDRHSSHLPV